MAQRCRLVKLNTFFSQGELLTHMSPRRGVNVIFKHLKSGFCNVFEVRAKLKTVVKMSSFVLAVIAICTLHQKPVKLYT